MPGQNAARTMLKLFRREDKKGARGQSLEESRHWDAVETADAYTTTPTPDAATS